MKKNKLFLILIFLANLFFSQVGIGTTSPHSSSILDLTSTNKALLLTRLDNVAAVVNPTNGMLIYDNSFQCIRAYQNSLWSNCLLGTRATVDVDCNQNGFEGNYITGTAMNSANSFSVTITNNSFSTANISFSTTDLSLSGVGGITVNAVTPSSVILNGGQSQLISYTLTGTPSSSGTLTGHWTKVSLECIKNIDITDPSIASLDCSGAANNGTLVENTPATGVSSTIPYTGGNGTAHSGQTVMSTGVTGLTATLAAGNFASGSGNLTYNITGTPSSAGVASFSINIGGKSCTMTRNVSASIVIPPTITLAQNRKYIVASVFDRDYLPYTVPSGAATTNAQTADSSNEPIVVDVQGTITTTGINLKIPVTATGAGVLPAYSTTISIPANLTEDGISRNLTLSWASQAYTASTTSIAVNIKSVGGTLNAKKLDINAGIGNDALGVLLGSFYYPYNNAGNTTTYQVRDIAGIPDRKFGLADNSGSTISHMMLYIPIVAEDGNIWLNNNLGADYSNINSANFNPAQQATSSADYKAYGSLVQWGRKTDGHELINWTSASVGVPVNNTGTSIRSDNPTHPNFITFPTSPGDWRVTQDDTLWLNESSANNPCPQGFRLPTLAEFNTLGTAAGITNASTAASSALKLSAAGSHDSGMSSAGTTGFYYTSSVNNTSAYSKLINSSGWLNWINSRFTGETVRCIKD